MVTSLWHEAAPRILGAPMANSEAVSVIGGGVWGLALAAAAARSGSDTRIVSRRDFDRELPKGVRHLRDFDSVRDTRLVLLATPSAVVEEVARTLGDHLSSRHYVVHGIRGLVATPGTDALATVSEIVARETPVRRMGALGGPVLAQDLLQEKPTVLVGGSPFREVTDALRETFASAALRVYPTKDLRGLEWASALVGCYAIAVGFAEGLGLGAGLVAAIVCRSMHEASRIAAAAGGDAATLLGLSGYGDLLASASQAERPEIRFGRALAEGRSPMDALQDARLRVEAVELVPRILRFAEAQGVKPRILGMVAHGATVGGSKEQMLTELMTLPVEFSA